MTSKHSRQHGLDILSPHRIAVAKSFDARLAPTLDSLKLEKFETCLQCLQRQGSMLKLFGTYPPDETDWRALARCDANTCALDVCTEACHPATMKRRLAALESGLPILAAHPGPKWDVSLVHPLWEAAPGTLAGIRMKRALQWNYRLLRKLKIPGLVSMGIFEVSLNRNLSGEVYWAGGIHQIVCGASQDELRLTFEIPRRYRDHRPNQRMVYISPVERLATQFTAFAARLLIMQQRRATMRKLLTIVALLVLGGCAAPQEQALKQMPSAALAQRGNPVNCTTIYERNNPGRTICN